jgi:predicted nucleotidyltransferase
MTTDAATIDRVGLAERERVLTLLRAKEAELRALGVTRLRLFGSMARGEAMERRCAVDPSNHQQL